MSTERQLLDEITASWNRSTERETNYRHLLDFLIFLDQQLYYEYLPAVGPEHPEYVSRLYAWLRQFPEHEQPIALRLAGEACFYGSMDFAAIWQFAYRSIITRWLIDTLKLPLDLDLEPKVSEAMLTTWICSASDSMNIAGFFHVNNLVGGSIRPDWRSLVHLSNAERIKNYMSGRRLERVVILEDFVGSGKQIAPVLQLASDVSADFPVLVCPMLCCKSGAEKGWELAKASGDRIRFEPVSLLPVGSTLDAPASEEQAQLFQRVRTLAVQLWGETVQGDQDEPWTPRPLGFGDVGSLTVMHTNCPNNTLPLLHYYSPRSSWKPLFPRSARE